MLQSYIFSSDILLLRDFNIPNFCKFYNKDCIGVTYNLKDFILNFINYLKDILILEIYFMVLLIWGMVGNFFKYIYETFWQQNAATIFKH